MRFSSKINLLIFLTGLLLISACSNGENTNRVSNQTAEKNANTLATAKTDPAELGKIINLPIMPEEADWREELLTKQTAANQTSGANNRRLIAVLFFKPEDARKLVELVEKYKAAEAVELESETWFPAELIAQSQTSGNDTIKGAAYAVNDFVQPPYSSGRLTHIVETDYFVLELFAM